MKQTINFIQFADAFQLTDGFSYAGLRAIYDDITNTEEDSGVECELDVIAICADYTESNLDEYNADHGTEFASIDDAVDHAEWSSGFAAKTGEESLVYQNF